MKFTCRIDNCASYYDLKLTSLLDKGGVIRLGDYFLSRAKED